MKKLSLPAILILLFLFVSCTPVEFFHSFSCSTDKDVYQIDEKICFNIKGEVPSKLYKDGTLYIYFSTSEEIIDINELVTHYENLNSKNIEFTGIESNHFVFNVSSNCFIVADWKYSFSPIKTYKVSVIKYIVLASFSEFWYSLKVHFCIFK